MNLRWQFRCSALFILSLIVITGCAKPENCQNGVDDDGDGNIDCNDPECAIILACIPENCSNQLDDNGNGSFDCDDDDCINSPVCLSCGNGQLDQGETCDDGNTTSGDGCASDCTIEVPLNCQDGQLDAGEQCDDGNNIPADGCEPNCTFSPPTTCGNGQLDVGEQCDDGNNQDGDGCQANCILPVLTGCGDGVLGFGEQCDDDNNISGDGCRANCTVEVCGDNLVDAGEECDDGNNISGDNCRADCAGLEVCGDDLFDPVSGEECDQGLANSDNTPDACRTDCSLPICGDLVEDASEECDDGNIIDNDGCNSDCTLPICINGVCSISAPCDQNVTNANSTSDIVKALGLCHGEVTNAVFVGPSDPIARALVSSFGNAQTSAFEGSKMLHLSSGIANTAAHSQGTNLNPSNGAENQRSYPDPKPDPNDGCSTADPAFANDYTELKLTILPPDGAQSASFRFQFFSAEYPRFRCTDFDDTFLAILDSPAFQGNVSFDDNGNVVSLNSSFFEICNSVAGNTCLVPANPTLNNTGYDPTANNVTGPGPDGGATLPLTTTFPITPGQPFTLRFIIFDEGENASNSVNFGHILDSSVLIDSFVWHAEPVAGPNTIP